MLGPRVNALSLRRPVPPYPAARQPPATAASATSAWERVAHAVMRSTRSPSSSRRSRSCSSRARPSSASSRACRAPRSIPAGVESRDAYVALQEEFEPGETTPIIILADVRGRPDRCRQHPCVDRSGRVGSRDRRHRPGRGPVHPRRSPDRRAPAGRHGRRPLRAARRRSGRRASTRCSRATFAARRSGSMPSARARRRCQRRPT